MEHNCFGRTFNAQAMKKVKAERCLRQSEIQAKARFAGGWGELEL
jgi:hypothetical protein